jgi:hypothetical protein
MGAEVELCTFSWERLGNLQSRANAETQGGCTRWAGEEQKRRERWLISPPTGFAPLVEAQKSGETGKAWDTVPAWVGQARFLRTLNYESLTKRVQHADVQRARRNILKTHLSRQ